MFGRGCRNHKSLMGFFIKPKGRGGAKEWSAAQPQVMEPVFS